MNDRFLLLIQTALDQKGVKTDYNKIKQMFDKDPAKINAVMDMSATKTEINKFIKEYAPQLQKMFSNIGVEVDLKDLETSMKSVFNESEKAAKSLANAEKQAYEMNKTFDKQRLDAKNKMRSDEIKAYKDNESFNNKKIADEKSLFVSKEQAYKTNDSLRQKAIAEQKKNYLDELAAYKTNEELKRKEILKTSTQQKETLNLKSSKVQFDNSISTYLKNNTKLSTELKNKLISIQSQIKNIDKTGLSQLKNSFKEVSGEASKLGQVGQTSTQKFMSDLGNFTTFLGAGTLIMSGVNGVRQLVSTVSDLDKSLVDLQQSTGYTQAQAKELLNTYIDLGQELGATGTEVAASASEWLRQGKSISDTNTLIKDSMILSKVGQIDSAQSTEYLTSAMKGYGVQVSGVLGIVDKLSAVDMNSATNVSGLALAMSKVANMANLAGVNMDKLLSYLATVGEVTQKDMSSIGESFQTMFSRMGNIKLGKMTDSETGESLNDVEGVLGKIGIKLRDSNDSFRDFGDVLDDIGNKWGSLSQVEQNALGVAIAGTRQRENFTVLMTNYSKSLEYASVSAGSSGVAMQKFSAYEESVEAKTKKLQATFQEFATNTLNSSFIKGFLDGSNALIKFADDTDLLNTALEIFALVMAAKVLPAIGGMIVNATSYIGLLAGIIAEEYAATGATGAFSVAMAELNTIMEANPIGVLIAGATALVLAVKGVVSIYDYFNHTLKEQEEISKNLKAEYDDLQSQITSTNTELQSTIDKINELENKDSLTLVEQDELQKLKDTNEELENQLYLLKQQSDYDNEELNKSISTEYQKKYQTDTKTSHIVDEADMAWYDKGLFGGNEEEYVNYLIDRLKTLTAIKEKNNKLTKEEEKEYNKISKYLVGSGTDYADYASRYTKDDGQKEFWLNMVDLIASSLNTAENAMNESSDIIGSSAERASNATYAAVTKSKASITSFYDALSDESASKAIDSFQTNIKSIGDALANLSSLSSSDILDLMQQFPTFDWKSYGVIGVTGVGNLEGALKELASQQYDTTIATTGSSDAIKAMYDNAVNAKKEVLSFSDALSKFNSSGKALSDLKAEIKDIGGISSDTLSNLASKFPALEEVVSQYNVGLASSGDVLKALSKVYKTDSENYKKSIISKNGDSESFYKGVVDNLPTWLTSLASAYDLDLKNFSTLTKAKAELQKRFFTQMSIANTASAAALAAEAGSSTNAGAGYEQASKAVKAANDLKKIIDGLDTSFTTSIKFKDYTSSSNGSNKDKTKSSTKDKTDKNLERYNSAKAELEHKRAMGLSDKKYYAELKGLEDKYLKDKKKYKEQRWSIDEAIYQHQQKLLEKAKELAEKTAQEAYDKWGNGIDKIVNKYSDLRDAINKTAEDQTGTEQIETLTRGIKSAGDEIDYLKYKIKWLMEGKNHGAFDVGGIFAGQDYDAMLKELRDALAEAQSSIQDFYDAIAESTKTSLESISDELEKSFDKSNKATDKQKDAYADIINAQKELLQLKKEQADYEKTIAEKTKDISKIENRMAELALAAGTGDREAQAELNKLAEEDANKKSELADAQSDHAYDLANDALDKALDDNNDILDAQKEAAEEIYNDKKDKLDKLYAEEEYLIKHASDYTQVEFASKMTALHNEINDIVAKINGTTGGNVEGQSDSELQAILDAQAKASVAKQVNAIIGLKSDANKSQDTSGLSGLNKYVASEGYGILSKQDMVDLAQALNLNNINDISMVGTNEIGRINKNLIMEALKSMLTGSTFATGGVLGGTQNRLVKSLTGEDAMFAGKIGEGILTQPQTIALQSISGYLPAIDKMFASLSLNSTLPNLVNNKTLSPTINISIPIQGNADSSTVSGLNNASNNIVKQIMSEVRKL